MRRATRLFEQIIDRENLGIAVHKALRSKRSRDDARAFLADLDEKLDRSHDCAPRKRLPAICIARRSVRPAATVAQILDKFFLLTLSMSLDLIGPA